MSSQDINIYPAVNGGVGIGQAHTHNNTSKLEVNGNIFTNSHITASGQISASKIIADANLTSSFHSIYAETSVSASGNISASGIYYGKQREHTYHQFDEPSDSSANFIPAPGAYVIEGTTINYYRKWLAPYDGNLIKCIIYAENDPDNTRLSLYLNGSYQARKTVAMDAATPATFDMTDMDGSALNDDCSFDAGDLISIAMDPANAPGEVNLVCTWEYKIID